MKIQPQNDFIYIKVEKIEKLGRIEIPDTVKDDEEKVTVLGIGPEVEKIKVGNKIICMPKTGIQVPAEGEMRQFIREKDVMAVIK